MSLRGATDPNTAAMGTSMNADPQSAQALLTSMIHKGPAVGAAGTNNQPQTPGGEMGGANTPTTNPIGMMSGLGVDPGGDSVMGNAAFGTQNNVMKIAQWIQKRSGMAPAVPKRFPSEFKPRIGGLPPKPGQVPMSQAPKPQPPGQTIRGPSTAPKYTMKKTPQGWQRVAVPAAQYRSAVANQPTRHRGGMAMGPQKPMMAGQGAGQYDPVAALQGAPEMPQGMTQHQQQVWAQRGGDPAWAARARAFLAQQQQPQQQLAQAPQRTTAKIPGAEWAKQREAYLAQQGHSPTQAANQAARQGAPAPPPMGQQSPMRSAYQGLPALDRAPAGLRGFMGAALGNQIKAGSVGHWIVKRAMQGAMPPPQAPEQQQAKTQAQINRELTQQPKQKPNLPPIVNGPAGPVKQAEQLMAFIQSRKGR